MVRILYEIYISSYVDMIMDEADDMMWLFYAEKTNLRLFFSRRFFFSTIRQAIALPKNTQTYSL